MKNQFTALLLASVLLFACNNGHGNQMLRGGAGGEQGLPPNEVIARIPLGDIAGVASSDLATRIRNPYSGNPKAIEEGHALFLKMNCASCHGYGAKGGMGPDLTDGYWRFGGAPAEIYKTIFEGRAEGMPAWGRAVPASQIWKIVAYIETLGGTVPASFAQKGLQGDVPKENEPKDTMRTAAPEKKQ